MCTIALAGSRTASGHEVTCTERNARWRTTPPPRNPAHVFGVGSGRTLEAAGAASRVRAAEQLGVEVRSTLTDVQSVETQGDRAVERSRTEEATESRVLHTLEGCAIIATCVDGDRTVHALSRCSARTGEERRANNALVLRQLPVCGSDRAWSQKAPAASAAFSFGVASATDVEAADRGALEHAFSPLGEAFAKRSADRQVDWSAATPDRAEEAFAELDRVAATRKREASCELVDRCRDPDGGGAHALARCHRKSPFERGIVDAAALLAAKLPTGARILSVPGNSGDGLVTGLGELAASLLRDSLAGGAEAKGARVVRAAVWKPEDLHAAARTAGASHLLRLQYELRPAGRARVEAWVQSAADDAVAPGATMTFEAVLDDSERDLLDVRGPLLPQQAAMSIAADLAPRKLAVRLASARLREGEEVSFEISVEQPGYLYVLSMEEDGAVSVLRPVSGARDARVMPGFVAFPDRAFRTAVGRLVACGNHRGALTRENFKVLLTRTPIELPEWLENAVVLEFGGAAPRPTAELLARINRVVASSSVLAEATVPYTIDSTVRDTLACP